jgi:2-polyprenyl-6-methoxyphenol hydroxylase-like FAD-dependent oxidoreductase
MASFPLKIIIIGAGTAVLGQGGAMAIEDAVCIARLLPADTPASEVEDRVKLYEEIGYKRAEYVREQTRRNGLDEEERSSGGFTFLVFLLASIISFPC